jgi:hypothetical protein
MNSPVSTDRARRGCPRPRSAQPVEPGPATAAGRQAGVDAGPVRCWYATRPAERPDCELTAVLRYGQISLCADCAARRSTVGKGLLPRRLSPRQPIDLLGWIAEADHTARRAEADLAAAVVRARAHGHSWAAIGARLNVTRQAAQQRFGPDRRWDPQPVSTPRGPTEEARERTDVLERTHQRDGALLSGKRRWRP